MTSYPPRCLSNHAVDGTPPSPSSTPCSACYATPTARACSTCSTTYALCATCLAEGRETYAVEFTVDNAHLLGDKTYAGGKWTGSFSVARGRVPAPDPRGPPDALVSAGVVLDLTVNLFEGVFGPQAVGGVFRNGDLVALQFVEKAQSGKAGHVGEIHSVGCNAGFSKQHVPYPDYDTGPWFGWLNDKFVICGFGRYSFARKPVSEVRPSLTPQQRLDSVLKVFFGVKSIAAASDMLAKGGSPALAPKPKPKGGALSTLTRAVSRAVAGASTTSQQSWSADYAAHAKAVADSDVWALFVKSGEAASAGAGASLGDYELGGPRAPDRGLDMDDLVFTSRLSMLAYLATPIAFPDFYATSLITKLVDPRWVAVEAAGSKGAVPGDLLDKAHEYLHMRFVTTFFDQTTSSPTYGTCKPLADPKSVESSAYAPMSMQLDQSKIVSSSDVQAAVANSLYLGWSTGGDLTIAFRGTTNVSDALRDLDGRMMDFDALQDVAAASNAAVSLSSGDDDAQPRVHEGFYRGFLLVRDALESAVKRLMGGITVKSQHVRVVVTGHSMGGALALLCTAWLARWLGSAKGFEGDEILPNVRVLCVTYASPKVGNAAFCRMLESDPALQRSCVVAVGAGQGLPEVKVPDNAGKLHAGATDVLDGLADGDEVVVLDSTDASAWLGKVVSSGKTGWFPASVAAFDRPTTVRPVVRVVRVLDLLDVMPMLPPDSMGYRHFAGETAALGWDGSVVFLPPRVAREAQNVASAAQEVWDRMGVAGDAVLDHHQLTSYLMLVTRAAFERCGHDATATQFMFGCHAYAEKVRAEGFLREF